LSEEQEKRDSFSVYVGGRLRKIRLERRMKQNELAQTLDLSFQQIQKYEYGNCAISARNLFILARKLDVPMEYFIEGFDLDSISNG
jgi:transcriptional regulator with XRE-family HTH domain